MDCIVQPQNALWTGAIPHGLPTYHQRNFFPNFYFPRKRSFNAHFFPGPSLFFPHDDDVDYPTDMKAELTQTMPYHNMVDDNGDVKLCVVCGERASGFYFGALVCLPCKSFYIRCTKDGEPTFTCQCSGNCDIVKQGRIRCQYCRYQRCLMAGMCRKEKPETVQPAEGQVLCKVCGDIANGIHFGVNTCEGCKKFFRRGLVENQSYICKGEKECGINPRNRNNCRYCRYQKCLTVGMSREAIKMGRPKKGDGSEASCNLTSSPKMTRQPLADLENNNQLTNPQLGEEAHDTLKTSSARENIKEENLRTSCHFEKKLGEVCDQGHQGHQVAPVWPTCSQGNVISHNNHGQIANTATSPEFIEEEMDEILMMLQNDNQSGSPAKKMRCHRYSEMEMQRPCKTEFGMQNQEWLMNNMSSQPMNEPMNMSASHINQMRPPPQYPGYASSFQQDCMPRSPCHSPKSQLGSPRYMESSMHSPGYVPNGSPAHSPSCQYSPRHSPMYQHSQSPQSPYQDDICQEGSPYNETLYQNEAFSPQDNYQVTDLSVNVNCGLQNMMTPRSPIQNSPAYNSQMTQLSSTSPAMTIPHQEGGVNSQDGWCLTGSPSFFCDSPSQTSVHTTIPTQEGTNRRSSRLANLQKINHYFMSQSPCDLLLSQEGDLDGTMTRSDIEEEIVNKTLASVSPAESFYYVLSDSHSYSSDSNCCTNYNEFTSCQRVNKRKTCDSTDIYDQLRMDGSSVGRYNSNLTKKYWQQISQDKTDIHPMTSDKQALLEHVSKIFEQMLERCSESTKQMTSQDSHSWQQIQLRIVRNTSAAVKFASQIPGFSSLHPEDKAFLCKSVTFMSTLLMAGQHLYSPTEKNFRDFWNWQITPQNPFFPFKQKLLEIGEKIQATNMDVYEISSMAALIFLASDFLDLAYPEAIEESRTKIIAALKSYEMSKGIDVRSRLTQLFALVPEIRHVGIWHQQLMKQMKIHVQKQDVQQLFDAVNYRES